MAKIKQYTLSCWAKYSRRVNRVKAFSATHKIKPDRRQPAHTPMPDSSTLNCLMKPKMKFIYKNTQLMHCMFIHRLLVRSCLGLVSLYLLRIYMNRSLAVADWCKKHIEHCEQRMAVNLNSKLMKWTMSRRINRLPIRVCFTRVHFCQIVSIVVFISSSWQLVKVIEYFRFACEVAAVNLVGAFGFHHWISFILSATLTCCVTFPACSTLHTL